MICGFSHPIFAPNWYHSFFFYRILFSMCNNHCRFRALFPRGSQADFYLPVYTICASTRVRFARYNQQLKWTGRDWCGHWLKFWVIVDFFFVTRFFWKQFIYWTCLIPLFSALLNRYNSTVNLRLIFREWKAFWIFSSSGMPTIGDRKKFHRFP